LAIACVQFALKAKGKKWVYRIVSLFTIIVEVNSWSLAERK
jgi:hypothetical protein